MVAETLHQKLLNNDNGDARCRGRLFGNTRLIHAMLLIIAAIGLLLAINLLTRAQISALLAKVDLSAAAAALVGVSGYIVNARNARQGEVRAAHLERATNQMSNLLVPVNVCYYALMMGLADFLDANWFTDDNSPEGSKEQEAKIKSVEVDVANEEGKRYGFAETGSQLWIWHEEGGLHQLSLSGRKSACCRFELPRKMEAAIRQDPESRLATSYRAFIRNIWMPGVRQIAEIVEEHSHLMEPVPLARLQQLFGPTAPNGQCWGRTPRGYFFSLWINYARAWQSTLELWDKDDFLVLRPQAALPVGIFWVGIEGQTVAGEMQKKLTGQSQMHGSHGKGIAPQPNM
eukprot:TRINITY_DN3496_c0_g2_i3.p1 TRINITY_DN3496_c0_g2~~TRINITY_DN3496_c0_g2_i3.p1  ORF type:complete len:345 (-),score=49.49 TRINITY_DN3496_c0_g2_i3:38-1072(-)